MKIPKIIHRVWIGDSSIPKAYQIYWEGWKKLHPRWDFFDWQDEEISSLNFFNLISNINSPAAAADIARYEIIFKYGGVYIDCDFECKKPIDNLIENEEFVICNQQEDLRCFCSNGFFASTPGHPILNRAITDLKRLSHEDINKLEPAEVTGPYFFRRVINTYKVKILSPNTLYPYMHYKSELFKADASQIYAIHHWGGSWLSTEVLLWLAKQQIFSGDHQSCMETIHKIKFDHDLTLADKNIDIQLNSMIFLVRLKSAVYTLIFKLIIVPLIFFLQLRSIFPKNSETIEEEKQIIKKALFLRA